MQQNFRKDKPMKTKIAGLILMLMGITMGVITEILFGSLEPEYLSEPGICLEIFRIGIFVVGGLNVALFFGLLVRLKIREIIICSLGGLIIGVLVAWFCLTGRVSNLKVFIMIGAVVSFPCASILFFLDGVGFMFSKPYLISDP